eukprot:snap_masked-scaffold1753_size28935-processed-gene-0.2 protein:Tk08272 transcript:snap_masked-scaffold1753_size28935-processed-gene-0.2-mRNA-1 annotation:"alpha-amylase"
MNCIHGAQSDIPGLHHPTSLVRTSRIPFNPLSDLSAVALAATTFAAFTYKEPFNYKLGVSFMLAHDYGSKRVMSSYFFEDSDQGAPTSAPGCGEGWVCEHRWNSIGNMVEFANAVNGETVENWVGEADMVAFSRGAKGFYAMGNVSGREFATGLPDGDYCDIISECAQTITISGGMGTFALFDSEEPAVAICVGCG